MKPPSRHRRNLSVTNIAFRSGNSVSGAVHLVAACWICWKLHEQFCYTALALLSIVSALAIVMLWVNLRRRQLLDFSERRRTRNLALSALLFLCWSIACVAMLVQVTRSRRPLPLLLPSVAGGMALFSAGNAVYSVLLALAPGET